MSSHNKKARNPFAERKRRTNFPEFDQAFAENSRNQSTSSSSNNNNVDQSTCSFASTTNLSIGARAALDDHLRHVARHGLDDSTFSLRMANEEQAPRDPLDVVWDRLVDSHNTSTSLSHSFLHVVSSDDRFVTLAGGGGGGDSPEVEVVTAVDQSVDYFNTSRVMLLMTPDRNRDTIHAITSRGCHEDVETSLDLGLPPHPFSPAVDRMDIPNFSIASEAAASVIDNSFSLSAVDLSRISADGSDDGLKRSPDTSFVADHRTTISDTPFVIPEGILSPERTTTETPFRRRRGDFSKSSSSSSSFRRSPTDSGRFRMSPPPLRSSPPTPIDENLPDLESRLTLSPIRSPPRSVTETAPLPPRSRLSHSTAATSRFLFAETSQHKHQVPTPTKPRHMILEYPTYHPNDSDISTLQNSSSEHNHSRSSSSISEINRSMGIPPGDRRRFRTVVPSRVFWTDPVDEFPEQYDSFLAPSPRMADSARSVQSARF